MISASALNSELINKIAQDFAQATGLAWLSIFMVMKYLSYSISRRFVS